MPIRDFARILLAVDGSDASARAIDVAADLAAALHSEVRVIHVTNTGRGSRVLVRPEGTTFQWESPDESESLVDDAAKQLRRRGLTVSTETPHKFEPIGEEIADAARTFGAQMIIMGSAGRGAVGSAVFGSVAQRVLHDSAVPVLVVR